MGISLAYVYFAGKWRRRAGCGWQKCTPQFNKTSYLSWLQIFHFFFFFAVTNEQTSEKIIDLINIFRDETQLLELIPFKRCPIFYSCIESISGTICYSDLSFRWNSNWNYSLEGFEVILCYNQIVIVDAI